MAMTYNEFSFPLYMGMVSRVVMHPTIYQSCWYFFLSTLLVCKFIVIRLFTLFKGEGFNIQCVHAREIELNHEH
jgi:hypothetical protein